MSGTYDPHCRAVVKAVFDDAGDIDPDPVVIGLDRDAPLVPKTASIHYKGYAQGSWAATFDHQRFPFSPFLIKNAAIDLHMFDAPPGADLWTAMGSDAAVIMSGLFDDPGNDFDGGRYFSAEGRDYTALLLDRTWNPSEGGSGANGRVPVGRPLDETVQALVDEAVVRFTAPQFAAALGKGALGATRARTLTVRYVSHDRPPYVGGAMYKTKKRGVTVVSGRSYWDVIYGICLKHGKICFIRGQDLIISDPKTLTLGAGSIAAATAKTLSLGTGTSAFSRAAEAAPPNTPTSQVIRQFAYGRNIKGLRVKRHMAKEQVAQIVAASYDPRTRDTLYVQYPDKHVDISKKTGLATKKDTIEYVTAPAGITDVPTLLLFAATYYHHTARGEAKVSFETWDLTDTQGVSNLTLRPGDPIALTFDPFDGVDMLQLSVSERVGVLRAQGYADDVAEVVAEHYELLRTFRRPLRVSSVSFRWDLDKGIVIEIEAINYAVLERDDAPAP